MQNYGNKNIGKIPPGQQIKSTPMPPKNQSIPTRNVSVNTVPGSVRYERIRPMKQSSPTSYERNARTAKSMQKAKQKRNGKAESRLAFRDYIFGFIVGLVIFGIAAIIVCNALIGMIS